MVGVTGFEPAASTSQTSRATNCATPRYAIKLWSCKWSNMWSGTNLTAFLIFTNCPKSAPLKGFRRFFFSGTEWEIYAPKPRALPTALHPGDIYYISKRAKSQYLCRFFTEVNSARAFIRKRYCFFVNTVV